MTRVLLPVLTAAAVGSVAVPAPRAKAAPLPDAPVDLAGLHDAIAKAADSGEWTFGHRRRADATVHRLLGRLTAAAGLPDRPLPVDFDGVAAVRVRPEPKADVSQARKVAVVARGGRYVQMSDAVLLIAGSADVVQTSNCIVVASGDITLTQCDNCVAAAGRVIEATQCFAGVLGRAARRDPADGPPAAGADGPVLVAGTRMKLTQCGGGIAYVVRPAAGGKPAVEASQTSDMVYLTPPAESQGSNCRVVEVKLPLAE